MTNAIRAVFFDLGGTLFSNLDIPRVCMPVLTEASERLGNEGGLSTLGPAFIEATRRVNEGYLKRRFYLHRDLFLDSGRLMVELLGCPAQPGFVDWFYRAQRDAMVGQLTLRPDCLEMLRTLRSRGFQLALVSNIDEDFLQPMLDNFGLRPFLDHWISSQEARSCKPDPGIFHHALRRTACRPEEVIFVGDSRVHDIQGAAAAGIRSVFISEQGGVSHLDDAQFESRPDHVIHELGELCEWTELSGPVAAGSPADPPAP